jgi:hypothetical protein
MVPDVLQASAIRRRDGLASGEEAERYELRAVVMSKPQGLHQKENCDIVDDEEGGHSTLLISKRDNTLMSDTKTWFEIDDETVKDLSASELSSVSAPDIDVSRDAYVLFYKLCAGAESHTLHSPPSSLHLPSYFASSQPELAPALARALEDDELLRRFAIRLYEAGVDARALIGLQEKYLIGIQVEIKWKEGWFKGKIVSGLQDGKFEVLYEDGSRKTYNLAKKDFRFLQL